MTKKEPRFEAIVVPSQNNPGLLSVRVPKPDGSLSGSEFKRALTAAGFQPGDVIVITKAAQ